MPSQADRGKLVLAVCQAGLSAQEMCHVSGVFRGHLSSSRQVHLDQGNPERSSLFILGLFHPLQATCICQCLCVSNILLLDEV